MSQLLGPLKLEAGGSSLGFNAPRKSPPPPPNVFYYGGLLSLDPSLQDHVGLKLVFPSVAL